MSAPTVVRGIQLVEQDSDPIATGKAGLFQQDGVTYLRDANGTVAPIALGAARAFDRYGPDKTGNTASTNALQDAIDDTPVGGDILQLGPGTFKIDDTVSAGLTGKGLTIRGVGPATRLYFEMADHKDGLVINNAGDGGRCGLENLAVIGPQVLGSEITDPQCYRAVVLGGTYGGPFMRRVMFAGVHARGAVAYMGNGAAHGIVEHCDFIGTTALDEPDALAQQSLLELNILFALQVKNSRFVRSGYYDALSMGPGGSRQGIRIRHYDLPDGQYNNSQVLIDRCSFDQPGQMAISTLEADGNPNGPASPMQLVGSLYDACFPPGVGRWNKVTGTPSGGYPLGYIFQIRIDTSGARGVATWSTRFQDSGFGGGFTSWVSQGSATSAVVNGLTFSMRVGDSYSAGQNYQCYVVGTSSARLRHLDIRGCKVNSAPITLSQVDRVNIHQLDYDSGTDGQTAVELYDCDAVNIIQPYIRNHKIIAQAAGYGFGQNQWVYVEDPNAAAVLQLDEAVAWRKSLKGTVTP